jgi:hypothetical protein
MGVDVCLISEQGGLADQLAVSAERAGLYGVTRRVAVYGQPVLGVVESMNRGAWVGPAGRRCATRQRGWVSCRSGCGVRKLGSRGGAVFVDESAESVSALDEGCGRVRDLQLRSQGIGRLEIE